MKLRDFAFIADESFDMSSARELRRQGWNILEPGELSLCGAPDEAVFARAWTMRRALLAQDTDFGTIAVQSQRPFVGIVLVRPGHLESRLNLECVNAIADMDLDHRAPFIVVAEHQIDRIVVRVRTFGPSSEHPI